MGSLKSQLLDTLPTKINTKNINTWDSAGVELISPILQLSHKKEAVGVLGNYLQALTNSPNHDILKSKWAGMHVHIGLNISTAAELDANIKFFQHLIYILVSVEDLITECFPHKCSGLPPTTASEPISNSSNNSEEEPETEFDRVLKQIEDLEIAPESETEQEREARNAKLDELDALLQTLPSPYDESSETSTDDATNTTTSTSPPTASTEKAVPESQTAEEVNESLVLAAEASYTGYNSIYSNKRYFLSQIANNTFTTTTAENTNTTNTTAQAIFSPTHTFTSLIDLYQSPLHFHATSTKSTSTTQSTKPTECFRGHMYNFANLYNIALGKDGSETWKVPKPTVEFRQHECSIDVGEVERWVILCEGLVKKAGVMAAQVDEEGREGKEEGKEGYWEKEVGKYEDGWMDGGMRGLCRWLGLDEDDGDYWEERWERWRGDRPGI
jgi:hypothetical protein